MKNRSNSFYGSKFQQPPQSTTPPSAVLQSLEESILQIEVWEKLTTQQLNLKIEKGLQALNEQRKKNHEQFLQKDEEFITEVKSLQEQLQNVTEEQQ